MKKIIPVLLSAILVMTLAVPAAAAEARLPAREVVYGLLGSDGSVENIYVVNIFVPVRHRLRRLRDVKESHEHGPDHAERRRSHIRSSADKLYIRGR
jgi:hypothetical protein